MTLHPTVTADLLNREAVVARSRLGDRATTIDVADGFVSCTFHFADSAEYTVQLDARNYDAEPMRVAVVDADGNPLPGPGWPPGLCHSEHPVLQRPWTCLRGTYEYHRYPGHAADGWDHHRNDLRLADVLDHILQKCGR